MAEPAVLLLEAAGSVGRYLGPQSLNNLISIEGRHGTPHPAAWEFQVVDPAAPNGVQVVLAKVAKATRRNTDEVGYPYSIPGGFFTWNALKVDNLVAFKAADNEARQALIGFDSVHYLLRTRDGSAEPVWILTLLDSASRPVGRLEVSATTGKVERKVWLRYEAPDKPDLLRIEDSASPIAAMQPAAPTVLAPPALPNALPVVPQITPGESAPTTIPGSPAPIPAAPLPGTSGSTSPAPSTGSGGYEPLPPN